MTSLGPGGREDQLRAAVEQEDFGSAQRALEDYLAWFRSAPRDLPEVSEARNLMVWAVEAATSRKARIAQELGRLTTFFKGYGRPRISHTWHVDG